MYLFVELPFHLGVKLLNNISLLIQHHCKKPLHLILEWFPFLILHSLSFIYYLFNYSSHQPSTKVTMV